MRLRVLFFGMLKDLVGRPSEDIDLPDGSDLGAVFERYASRFPRLRELAPSIVAARNQEFAELSAVLTDGDEVAFLPPVSGGLDADPLELESAGHYFALTRCPIDTRLVVARLLNGEDGAVVTFEGVVRNNTKGRSTLYLDYECYESMALKMMAKIGVEIAGSYAVSRVAMVHRLGRMLIGEASVAVIVTAPHRKAAFDAALEGINRLKKLVPIWKKEHFVDGEVWVEGEWDRHAPVVG
jgi:molybdopterin synthase catalytic subunit